MFLTCGEKWVGILAVDPKINRLETVNLLAKAHLQKFLDIRLVTVAFRLVQGTSWSYDLSRILESAPNTRLRDEVVRAFSRAQNLSLS